MKRATRSLLLTKRVMKNSLEMDQEPKLIVSGNLPTLAMERIDPAQKSLSRALGKALTQQPSTNK